MVACFERGAIYLVIVAALAAELAASYGRELEAQRHPNRRWRLRQLLIIPLLAVAAGDGRELSGGFEGRSDCSH